MATSFTPIAQRWLDGLPDNTKIINLSHDMLTIIDVYHLKLTVLPDVSRFTEMEQLNCEDNLLTHLPDNLPDSIIMLRCCDNLLVKLPDKLPSALIELYCGRNKLTALPEVLSQNIVTIQCYHNEITMSSDNNDQFYTTFPNSLVELDCSFNKINFLPCKLFWCLTSLNGHDTNCGLDVTYPFLLQSVPFLSQLALYENGVIKDRQDYVYEINKQIFFKRQKARMDLVNAGGCLVERALQWRMRPERMAAYLAAGLTPDDVNDFM
jgi:Leucine-rich repeat (LRR) protein